VLLRPSCRLDRPRLTACPPPPSDHVARQGRSLVMLKAPRNALPSECAVRDDGGVVIVVVLLGCPSLAFAHETSQKALAQFPGAT